MTDDDPVNDGTEMGSHLPEHKISPRISPNNSPTARAEKPAARGSGKRRVWEAFVKWLLSWPRVTEKSETAARCIWFDDMTEVERHDASAYTAAYLRANPRPPGPDVYLRGRLWKALPQAARARPRATDLQHAGYCGKLWIAAFLWALMQPPRPVTITRFERIWAEKLGETEEQMHCRRRAESGWPDAVRMLEAFRRRQKSFCDAALMPATDDFRQAEWDGEVVAAWRRLHQRRCWPFPQLPPQAEEGKQAFVWLPPVADPAAGDLDLQVEAALYAFETRVKEVLNGQDEG